LGGEGRSGQRKREGGRESESESESEREREREQARECHGARDILLERVHMYNLSLSLSL